MNVYEEAHKLSQAIKESNEYKEFVEVKKDVEANPELKEIVDFLKNPQKYIEMGARIPKGVLLVGRPGTR